MQMSNIEHPGSHIREHIIPEGMNVTEAAKRLEVSRPTLSNLLNGNADLSPDMAGRLAKAFGADARDLLNLQSAFDAKIAKGKAVTEAVQSYVPPFLEIKSITIESWASTGLKPRQRLAVLLRLLVNSTGMQLSRVSFPGNDDSEVPGADGEVESGEATPWIPHGRSVWEFGVNKDIKGKADGDFAKSVKALDATERKAITFVFVTPRRWSGKAEWAKAQKKKKLWKDVRALDASDLEQWLEQSIPAQVWFANETNQSAQGCKSLDQIWRDWSADCEPELKPSMFQSAVKAHRASVKRLVETKPYSSGLILADSKDEALAFLSCVFSHDDEDLGHLRDKVVVFENAETLTKLANKVSNFVPVVMSRDVEKALAPYRNSLPSFLVYARNATSKEPDVLLDTLNYEDFDEALKDLGLERDRIDQLGRESGRSLTVLRRRLSKLDAIQKPDWSTDKEVARTLVPALFAGVWRTDNQADCAMIECLAADQEIETVNRHFNELLPLDSSPVWSAGSFNGVVSKIDVLFAIHNSIIAADLERFFDVAEIILSEPDPSLELPEDERWAAGIHGKTRELSGAIREGVAETLVLLAVYGNSLFDNRLNFDCESRANRLVERLLTPLSDTTLETHIDNLALYAEAAPDRFLSIIEKDLESDDSYAMSLMRPSSSSMFSSSPRTGLLWALEGLAWSPRRFLRTVLVLGKLAEKPLDDNLLNKPSNSLAAMFRNWMPQTAANLDQRIAAFEKLVEKHPKVAWPIGLAQFESGHRTGHYSHKPKWRPDGHGYGGVTTNREANDFALKTFEIAVNWPHHTRETLADLVTSLSGVSDEMKGQVWDLVDEFAKSASEADKSWLRERIRTAALSRRALKRSQSRSPKEEALARAISAYEALAPSDVVYRHEWLFRTTWVDESAFEIEDEDFDFKKRDERIEKQRVSAIKEVYEDGGIDRVVELANLGQAAQTIGRCLVKVLNEENLLKEVLTLVQDQEKLDGSVAQIVAGALHTSNWEKRPLLEPLLDELDEAKRLDVMLIAPFEKSTWDILEKLGGDFAEQYWKKIAPGMCFEDDDLRLAVSRLVEAKRPRLAFDLAHWKLKALEPRTVYRLLRAIISSSEEPSGHNKLDGHYLRDAIEIVTKSGAASVEELSVIEFQFLDIFRLDQGRPENLEKWIEQHPELFVQSVAMAFKREDGGDDPPELHIEDEDQRMAMARQSYTLLDTIKRIPGHDDEGSLRTEILLDWIENVREKCGELSRSDMGDQCIGKLLSHSPANDDGTWPSTVVCDALEQVANEQIKAGMTVALFNSRGVHWRGEGGDQERELASKYGRWADAVEYTHPRVSDILRYMEERYLWDAKREDQEAQINRRMRIS